MSTRSTLGKAEYTEDYMRQIILHSSHAVFPSMEVAFWYPVWMSTTCMSGFLFNQTKCRANSSLKLRESSGIDTRKRKGGACYS